MNRLMMIMLTLAVAAAAQNLTLRRDAETMPMIQVDERIWAVEMDGRTFLLLERSLVDSLTKKIARQEAVIRRHEAVLAAQDSLLARYQSYETAADAHIAKQQELLAAADSLQRGYRSLYFDAKKLLGYASFSATTGLGWINTEGSSQAAALVGLTWRRNVINALIGRKSFAIAIGIHWPIF
ncbi:MAG: hypothetical protein ONB24_01840 [candidate division KSB1 bacterium]|nr:hypothetical protein [candidate division KSB1 bacterium]